MRLDHEISAQLLVAWYCGEQLLDYSFQAWCPLPFCTKLHCLVSEITPPSLLQLAGGVFSSGPHCVGGATQVGRPLWL